MATVIMPLPDVAKSQERKLFDMQTLRDVINPANLLILFANLLAFVLLQTTFFWFVASRNVEAVLEDKSEYITELMSKRGITLEMLRDYLNSDDATQKMPEVAKSMRAEREAENFELLKTYILPVVIALGSALLLVFLALIVRGQPLTSIDLFLLFLVLGAFSTELYFYLTVTSQLIHLSDTRIVYELFNGVKRGYEATQR